MLFAHLFAVVYLQRTPFDQRGLVCRTGSYSGSVTEEQVMSHCRCEKRQRETNKHGLSEIFCRNNLYSGRSVQITYYDSMEIIFIVFVGKCFRAEYCIKFCSMINDYIKTYCQKDIKL